MMRTFKLLELQNEQRILIEQLEVTKKRLDHLENINETENEEYFYLADCEYQQITRLNKLDSQLQEFKGDF